MIQQEPFVKLLGYAKASLDLVDWEVETGIAGVKPRHFRNRNTTSEERPGVALRFDHDLPQQEGEVPNHNTWEKVRELALSIVVDVDLDSEESEEDPTGFDKPSRIAAVAMKALRDPTKPFAQKVDWSRQDSIDPDEDSTPDKGRLVYAVIVLYRVRSDDENVLLAQGETG